MKCKICEYESEKFKKSKIMNKYEISYYYCPSCEFIQTEEPYWIEEAYIETINLTDIGIMKRNQVLANFTTIILSLFFNKRRKFLDYAGGYGIFTRLMRDIGFDFYWSDKYTENLISKGFEYNKDEKYELLTSFEAFEHFTNPIMEIENMLKISNNILFSTTLTPIKKPLHEEWYYYGLDHGQHISFYSINTMHYLADKYSVNFYTNGKNIHLFTKKKINKSVFKFLYLLSRIGMASVFKVFIKSKIAEDARILLGEKI